MEALTKEKLYQDTLKGIESLIETETDMVAKMATVVCELHHAFDDFHWTGFYRVTAPELLTVGPYQGGHGCLRIPFSKGVCGKAARTQEIQLVPDVRQIEDHIACSSTTLSEIVLPVYNNGKLIAVFDVDSDHLAAFDEIDSQYLAKILNLL